MQIAFVTYDKFPDLTEDDQLIAKYLKSKEINVIPAIWDDPLVNWQVFDVIVIRSTWDYFEKPLRFKEWLAKLKKLNCQILNPLSVIEWNQDKNYFDVFSKKGILLPSYIICASDDQRSLKDILESKNWRKAVVKPAISGGAYNTWITRIETSQADEERFKNLKKIGDIIVQVFVDEVISDGELSLVFFNKKFSHAYCKKAMQGDFRVQTQFGGTAHAIEPSAAILTQAQHLLSSIEEPLLYARVDGVVTSKNRLMLMELELIEPNLSVASHAQACENFYLALKEILLLN